MRGMLMSVALSCCGYLRNQVGHLRIVHVQGKDISYVHQWLSITLGAFICLYISSKLLNGNKLVYEVGELSACGNLCTQRGTGDRGLGPGHRQCLLY